MNYPVREKELLAIIHALQTWRPYLLDKAFTVETDHKSLQELLTQRTCTQRLARWLNFISQYKPMFMLREVPYYNTNGPVGLLG